VTAEQALDQVRRRLAWLDARTAEPLTGGLLNEVFRVVGSVGSCVVKHAPPFVASQPDLPLDPGRSAFEGRALALFEAGGRLAHVARAEARPPRLLDQEGHTLILEDLGDLPDLAAAPRPEAAAALGGFLARLHKASNMDINLQGLFDNLDVQETRDRLTYSRVEGWLGRPTPAADLGRRLLGPGRCLVMGDAWPASVLVDGWGVRIIDWELAHFGRPVQDLAHLAAHLWLRGLSGLWAPFDHGYREIVHPEELDPDHRADFPVHFGTELLVRSVGPFPMEGSPANTAEVALAALLEGRTPDWTL
jgi:hypothetical protein